MENDREAEEQREWTLGCHTSGTKKALALAGRVANP